MDIEFYRLQKVIYSKENNYPKFWNCGEAKWYISAPICFGIKYFLKKRYGWNTWSQNHFLLTRKKNPYLGLKNVLHL